jgi:ABC-type multidrug transport system fused ATPase/permease subunit
MTRVTSDVEAIHEAFTSGLVLMLADGLKLIGIVVILLVMDWRLALVTFTVLPPLAAASWFFGGRVRMAWREVRRMVARLNAFLQENVSGMRVVQLFVREREARATFAAINREHRDSQMVGVRYDSIFSAFAEWSGTLTLAAIVWAGGGRILAGAMTFGTLVAFLEYADRFFRPLQELSQRYTTMQAAMAAAERIVALLDTPPEIVSPPAAYRPARRPEGSIVFDNVTFGYRPDLPVLHGVSFGVRAGESVGVVGWTGSGKSTLLRLLVRLYDVWEGRVLVDGIDVRQWDLGELRRTVGVVPQEPFLFAGTLESNVSLGDPRVDLDTVRRAAALVRADELVARQPQGWATEVHERGANLSMGERQLLAFARAVALDPVILALDEATASIDPRTEHRIQEALGTARAGRTALVIAHRLATIQGADRILVLHRGRLREQGSHEELLRLDDGIYRTLFSLQSAT